MTDLDVEKLQAPMRDIHVSGVNLTLEWRTKQLGRLLKLVQENTHDIRKALAHDLGRDPCEAVCVELKPIENDLIYAMKNLRSWMRPTPVPSPGVMAPCFSYLERKPLEAPGVLLIGPFNYPILLILRPLIGVLAGGNPAVLKPTELCPESSNLLKDLIEKYFDDAVVQVVLGDHVVSQALLKRPWAKVMFTGSGRVGKIVAEACAKTMTPTILELGGKCPVVVDETVGISTLQNVADRIIFAKCMNAGQICLAPDTLFVHESLAKGLCDALARAIETQFGKNPKESELGRIVNTSNANRIREIIEDAEDKASRIIYGGSSFCDVDERYICPTVILDPPAASRILQEEIFGPVLPMVTFTSRKEVIERIRKLGGIPLQLYIFTTSNRVFKEYTDCCRSAGAFRNDCVVQAASGHLPFGGLGSSGNGNYHGKFSFDSFTHLFPSCYRPIGSVWDLKNVRCHPYAGLKSQIMERVAMNLPDIAVLHTRKLLLGLTIPVVITLLSMLSPSTVRVCKESAASVLEVLVQELRK